MRYQRRVKPDSEPYKDQNMHYHREVSLLIVEDLWLQDYF